MEDMLLGELGSNAASAVQLAPGVYSFKPSKEDPHDDDNADENSPRKVRNFDMSLIPDLSHIHRSMIPGVWNRVRMSTFPENWLVIGFEEGSSTMALLALQTLLVLLGVAHGARRSVTHELAERGSPKVAPLTAIDRQMELERFMGRWYVHANIPTFLDRGSTDNIEDYEWNNETQKIKVTFTYTKEGKTETSQAYQKATVFNDLNTEWRCNPKFFGFFFPLKLAYLVVDLAEDYSSTIVAVPDRAYLWIMTRSKTIDEESLQALIKKSVSLGYREEDILRTPFLH